MRKGREEYKMVQMDTELHTYLKDYCKQRGFTMAGFIAALVRQALANNKKNKL